MAISSEQAGVTGRDESRVAVGEHKPETTAGPAARPSRRFPHLRVFVICLSLANLCFLNVWSRLQSNYLDYFRDAPPDRPALLTSVIATVLDVVLVAVVCWIGAIVVMQSKNATVGLFGRLLFLGALVLPLNILRTHYNLFAMRIAYLVPLAVVAVLLVRWNRRAVAGAGAALFVLSPLFPIEVALAVQRMVRVDATDYKPGRLASIVTPARPATRTVWIIFDELDHRLAFEQRPPSVQMPEFDRLRAQALSAERTERAGRDTLVALPALMTGRPISKANVIGLNRLELIMPDGRSSIWPDVPTVVSRARALGLNTAVAGWYHPYCRIFSDVLTSCAWAPAASQFLSEEAPPDTTVPQRMAQIALGQAEKIPGLFKLGLVRRASPDQTRGKTLQVREYELIHDAALKLAADARQQFIIIHLPIPHAFGIFDSSRGALSTGKSDYLDNLRLADRALGEIRQVMDSAGIWDSSCVFVSSDHSLRSEAMGSDFVPFGRGDPLSVRRDETPWVPLFIKLPYQQTPASYSETVNASVSADLLIEILTQRATTVDDVARRLERSHRHGEPTYPRGKP